MTIPYRSDVDGLHAVAVLSVLVQRELDSEFSNRLMPVSGTITIK